MLYRPFGSAAIMADQLRKLQDFARRPNISIKVVPLSEGASPALRGSFTLLEFDGYPDVLFIGGPRGDLNVYEPEATRARRETWLGYRVAARVGSTTRPLHTKGA